MPKLKLMKRPGKPFSPRRVGFEVVGCTKWIEGEKGISLKLIHYNNFGHSEVKL